MITDDEPIVNDDDSQTRAATFDDWLDYEQYLDSFGRYTRDVDDIDLADLETSRSRIAWAMRCERMAQGL